MAGVTDKPFGCCASDWAPDCAHREMTTSDPRFWHTAKSLHRMDHSGEPDPVSVQIAGTVPAIMAQAARHNVDHGAQLIDINMGCPAKKVCNAWAGSALMRDEALVAGSCRRWSAVEFRDLKIRTGQTTTSATHR
jgi:tRNA-dihydrouridine synthase B